MRFAQEKASFKTDPKLVRILGRAGCVYPTKILTWNYYPDNFWGWSAPKIVQLRKSWE